MSTRATMRYLVVSSVAIMVHTKDNPSEEEWSDFMTRLRQDRGRYGCALIFTDGGGPSTMQRGQMNDAFEEIKFKGKVAVVTVSRLARGIVTALSWFNPNVKSFTPLQVNAALEYLEVLPGDQDKVRNELTKVRSQLGLSAT